MLEQLLSHARQDLAAPELVEAVRLDIFTKSVVADQLPEAAARQIDLGFTLAEDIVVVGSTFALTAAIRNLVENAVKFTPDGGSVDLGVYREGEMAVF